jgi:hypothetical protein
VTPQELERVKANLERRATPKAKSSGLSRTAKVNPVNKERREKRNALAFGPCARLARLTPCCVPTCKRLPPGDPAHVRSRGAGGKDWANVVPFCRKHHDEQHALGVPAFEDRHQIHLEVIAGFIAEAVRDHDCCSWPERAKTGLRCAVCLKSTKEPLP